MRQHCIGPQHQVIRDLHYRGLRALYRIQCTLHFSKFALYQLNALSTSTWACKLCRKMIQRLKWFERERKIA
jgi:hypothetical protein